MDGITTGSPISMLVRNKDQRSKDYEDMEAKYRPSHADDTYDAKYGVPVVVCSNRIHQPIQTASTNEPIGGRWSVLCKGDDRTRGCRCDREENPVALLSGGGHRH